MDPAEELGLDAERLTNMEEVVAKLLNAYDGPTEKLNLFIDYLEAAKHLAKNKKTHKQNKKYTHQKQTAIRRYKRKAQDKVV